MVFPAMVFATPVMLVIVALMLPSWFGDNFTTPFAAVNDVLATLWRDPNTAFWNVCFAGFAFALYLVFSAAHLGVTLIWATLALGFGCEPPAHFLSEVAIVHLVEHAPSGLRWAVVSLLYVLNVRGIFTVGEAHGEDIALTVLGSS